MLDQRHDSESLDNDKRAERVSSASAFFWDTRTNLRIRTVLAWAQMIMHNTCTSWILEIFGACSFYARRTACDSLNSSIFCDLLIELKVFPNPTIFFFCHVSIAMFYSISEIQMSQIFCVDADKTFYATYVRDSTSIPYVYVRLSLWQDHDMMNLVQCQ